MRHVDHKIFDLLSKFGQADQRIGQTMFNFGVWHQKKYGQDYFYIENDLFIGRLEKYFDEKFEEIEYTDSGDPPRASME
jgi:hypothetical protein